MFTDYIKVRIVAGNGGNGCISFHREKYVAAGGPDGGDGGRGANIYFKIDESVNTLGDIKQLYKGQNGADGQRRNCSGKSGDDVFISVPSGTIVKDAVSGRCLADMSVENTSQLSEIDGAICFLVAKGGRGGWGNWHFRTPTRQIPKFSKPGGKGEVKEVELELKLIADVGLIGYPNVGKSTLLSVISSARPKVADYPFTTLTPSLGVVRIDTGKSFVAADIPGLIEGASKGVGLGVQFLRHIERTRLLLHLVDLSGLSGRNPLDDFLLINSELSEYSPELAKRPQIVAASRCDVNPDGDFSDFFSYLEDRHIPYYKISAVTGAGVKYLLSAVSDMLDTLEPVIIFAHESETPADGDDSTFKIEKDNGVFVITGNIIERLVNTTNFGDYESLQYFSNTLKRAGIIDALYAAGCAEGDSVRAMDIEFDFYD